jgi:hypothetical protein
MSDVDDLVGPAQNFTVSLAEKVRGKGGLPEHIYRLGVIERLTLRYLTELRQAADPQKHAATLHLERLNELIAKHNRYYPIEANLPIDPSTGGSIDWRPMAPITVEWLLARL